MANPTAAGLREHLWASLLRAALLNGLQLLQPLPGIFDFGVAGVGVFPLAPNLTSNLGMFYHLQRWDEAKLARKRLSSQRSRKADYYQFGDV